MGSSALRFAFNKTIPVLFGYLFLGSACGLVLFNAGYNFIWVFFISLFVYAGSGQMLLATLLATKAPLISVASLTLLLNSRHMFYGLSFIDRFKKAKKFYPYMIFSLTDETYSILCATHTPKHLDDGKVIRNIAVLNHIYWIIGCQIGAVAGQLLNFNFAGVDFAMTALFVVIFVEQWQSSKSHTPVYIGMICSVLSLIICGADNFILPALTATVATLMFIKNTPLFSKDLNAAKEALRI